MDFFLYLIKLKRAQRGVSEVLTLRKGGGGHIKFWGSFNTGAGSFNHTEGGCKTFPTFKRGRMESFSLY